MASSTVLSVAKDEMDGYGQPPVIGTSNGLTDGFGTIRRSLRNINPFKNRLFRLPATPRLSRSKKVFGHGEEATSWNFERASDKNNLRLSFPSTATDSSCSTPQHYKTQCDRVPSIRLAPIATVDEYSNNFNRFQHPNNDDYDGYVTHLGNGVEMLFDNDSFAGGGSCRLNNTSYSKRRYRPSLPNFNPPSAHQASEVIHEHLRTLLPSPVVPPTNSSLNYSLPQQQTSPRCERFRDSMAISSNKQFLFLPNTSYAPTGEVYAASWAETERNATRNASPTQSTISLLNTQQQQQQNGFNGASRVTMRSLSSSSTVSTSRRRVLARDSQQRQSRLAYPLNGLFHQPSLRSICPNEAQSTGTLQVAFIETKTPPIPLFKFADWNSENELSAFLGREWLFKELYQITIVEKAPLVLLQGNHGSGKSAILNQLILNSSFFAHTTASNANTVDSGIVAGGSSGSQNSLHTQQLSNIDSNCAANNSLPLFSSRNYEWLRLVASRVVAFHNCHLYCAASCSIPEFVRNLVAYLLTSPLLRQTRYAANICGDMKNWELATSETASLNMNPVELFRELVLLPLKDVCGPTDSINNDGKTNENLLSENVVHNNDICEEKDPNCFIILVDALDEAAFHRNDGGESIGWLLRQTVGEFPPCLRVVVTSSSGASGALLQGLETLRNIRIDDVEMDERVQRDARIFVDYQFTINPMLEQSVNERRCQNKIGNNNDSYNVIDEFVDEVLHCANFNHLFLAQLFRLIEENKICLKTTNLSVLPSTLSQLYLIQFNLTFKSFSSYHSISPILSIILASLKPLNFKELSTILNYAEEISENELHQRLSLLSPMIQKLSSGIYVPSHQSFREWLLKESNETDYFLDVRYGHILLAISLVRQGNLNPEELFELGHHLLKANPHKYLRAELAIDLPRDRGAQTAWLRLAAGGSETSLKNALLFPRNTFYPNSKVSRLLLVGGADPNAIWPTSGDSLLCGFARSGNTEMLQLLLQYGADANFMNTRSGETPLGLAIAGGHLEAVKLLRRSGAKLEQFKGKNPLVQAAEQDSLEIIEFLLEESDNCEWNTPNKTTNTNCRLEGIRGAFEAAARSGKVRICRYLMDNTDAILETSVAMCIACANGQSEVVQFLLSRGATLSPEQSWNGKSALICAVESGSWDLVVNVLNSALIDLNVGGGSLEDSDAYLTPLMVAAKNGHVGLVDLLINRGAVLNTRDSRGRTAIMHAIEGQHSSTVALLIDRGADLQIKDFNGNTLIHLLAQYPNKAIINRLLDIGLSLEEKNNEELRAVEVAIKFGQLNAIDCFLRHGARLRSLTWQIALNSEPKLLLILIKKLLDDASILLKRKCTVEAVHRFNYALQKCSDLLSKCENEGGYDSENRSTSSLTDSRKNLSSSLQCIYSQLRRYKLQTLFSIAYLKRRNNEIDDALALTEEALPLLDNDEETRFELLLFRAKCHFDNRDLEQARASAQCALQLQPENSDAQNLLAVLNTPSLKP